MEIPHEMTTVSQVLAGLLEKGIGNEFCWTDKGMRFTDGTHYGPGEMMIIKVYRFEGISDPADMSVIYVIRTEDGKTGYSLNAYGAYSSHEGDEGYDNFIRQIREASHEEQLLFSL
jgi:hypothetical protein